MTSARYGELIVFTRQYIKVCKNSIFSLDVKEYCRRCITDHTYSPIYPLDVDINDASSRSLYSGPNSVITFLNE